MSKTKRPYITWKVEGVVIGTDTSVVRDGKISVQTAYIVFAQPLHTAYLDPRVQSDRRGAGTRGGDPRVLRVSRQALYTTPKVPRRP